MGSSISKCSNVALTTDLTLELLYNAQGFLRCLQEHVAPSSESKENWAQFYLVCDCLLRRYAISCHIRPEDLEDCLQSAWREITVALPKFEHHGEIGRLYAWLYLLVHSRAADLCRYRVRHPTRSLSPKKEAALRSRELDPAFAHERRDQLKLMQQMLAELREHVSDTNYRAFQLCCIEGRPALEVAAQLNLTVEQLRYRCYRVKEKVRRLYDAETRND